MYNGLSYIYLKGILNMRSRSPEWNSNLLRMLNKLEEIKKLPEHAPDGTHIHVGCGKEIFDGFLNIDKYYNDDRVLKYDMYQLPYAKDTISTIYSSHSLEHLPIRHAKMCLSNWYGILNKGGMLYLAIPDLEEIMLILTDPSVPDTHKEYWYMYTLFGYQADCSDLENAYKLDIPVDRSQFHTCGFSKKSISGLLVGCGFEIQDIYNYDGYATPSIWIEAKKN